MSDLQRAVQRKASFLQTVKAVAWAFFGVRRGAAHENDINQLNPVHLIIIGLMMGGVFIGSLVIIIKLVLA
ncbi:MAG: DUF2970 domain-containing protein [Burkholderiaceae bacterium]